SPSSPAPSTPVQAPCHASRSAWPSTPSRRIPSAGESRVTEMPKKNGKNKKDDSPPDLGDAVRSALERTFQAYTESGDRTRSVLDEMASAASRIRQSLQDMGAAD